MRRTLSEAARPLEGALGPMNETPVARQLCFRYTDPRSRGSGKHSGIVDQLGGL